MFNSFTSISTFNFNGLTDSLYCYSEDKKNTFLSPAPAFPIVPNNQVDLASKHPEIKKYFSCNLYPAYADERTIKKIIPAYGENLKLYKVIFSLQFHDPIEQEQLDRQKKLQDKGSYTDLHIQFG